FIINEIYRRLSYQGKQFKLSYLRVKEDLEIDLIIERGPLPPTLIEIKSSAKVDERHAKGLLTLGADFKSSEQYLLSKDPDLKKFSHVLACPWEEGIDRIVQASA
ncbi:MAG TPA: hypothetical protein DF383_10835, partial [Deltaproteobacteria bacterium]|nr:hypothetical protein [Deltaproteobacteria bacterium]